MTTASNAYRDQSAPLLEVVDLAFTHIGQPQPTIRNISLNLYPGELVVLAGATGSGKSTLLNCLTGIAPEHTGGQLVGQIRYRGDEISAWSIRQRSQIMGIMLQNVETQLFTDQVWEEIVFGLENWHLPPGEMQDLAQAAIVEFDLVGQKDWSIRQLSAGQKQRLLLACLLTRQPDLLLLDEPFAFLDTAGVELLLQLLQQRIAQGQSVLLIEHRLELLQDKCDRVYHIEAGQVQPIDHLEPLVHAPDEVQFPPHLPASTPKAPAILQTRDLSWDGYAPFPDLQVNAGDIVLLRGENGCGKTTLLRLISGLLKPTTGQIIVQGQDVTRQSTVQRAKTIGFVLQNPNHQLFAESVVTEVQQPGVDPDQAQKLLIQLNLSYRAEQHPHALSQGQKRRLALAAVLARQPQICLLDEIMVGQDATSLHLMLAALKEFTDQGGTLIFTSHDPSVAAVLQPCVIDLVKRYRYPN